MANVNVNNSTKVTLTVLLAMIIAFFGYRFMQDLPIFGSSEVIYTNFEQVNGLKSGSYIYINGVKVGSVSNLNLAGTDSVRVSLNFNSGTTITKGSVAYLESSGLLGDKAIYVQKGASTEPVPNGGTIKGVYSGGMLESFQENGAQLTDDASESFNKLNRTLTQLQQVVDSDNRQKIDRMLTNLERTSTDLSTVMRRKRSDLENSIENLNDVMANLDTITTANQSRIDSAFAGLERSMQNIEKVSAELESTNSRLNSILTKLDKGEGSLGKMINDPSLYNNLDSMSVELSRLVKNINEDPARYLKGLKLIDVF